MYTYLIHQSCPDFVLLFHCVKMVLTCVCLPSWTRQLTLPDVTTKLVANICREVNKAGKEKFIVYAAVKLRKSNDICQRSGLKQAVSP